MTLAESYLTSYKDSLTLKNGKRIFVRPILPTDKNLIVDFFEKLSPESVYMRFLNYISVLSENLLNQFTHIHYPSEFALVGIIKEDGKDAIVGVARYVYSDYCGNTELGIVIRDDWQDLGIGKALLKKVVDVGKENGIFRYVGLVHPDNQIIIRLLQYLSNKMTVSLKSGSCEVEVIV